MEERKKGSYYGSLGLILRNRDYMEADRLINVFTLRYGKVNAIAKGVKKAKSSLRACTQPFCYSDLFFRKGKSLDLITQGKTIEFFGKSRENMNTVMHLLYIMEVLDKVLPEYQPYPDLFSSTIQILEKIEEKGPDFLLLRYFESQVICQMGFLPVLNQCVNCGAKQDLGEFFSISEGGLLCKSCYQKTQDHVFIMNAEVVSILKLMLRGDLMLLERLQLREKTASKIEQFLNEYLEYHFERHFAFKKMISHKNK